MESRTNSGNPLLQSRTNSGNSLKSRTNSGASLVTLDQQAVERNETLDRIFEGTLQNLPALKSKIVRIFTSSTFTDTTLERNAFMEEVYPRLKEYCREKHGLEFQVVDMRWGVRDEATDDHMTTDLCMQEISNCQRLSMGPNFVVLLGQKYGYRPIPTTILASEFEKLRECIKNVPSDLDLIDLWYKRDDNAVPPVYILQPISSILTNFNNKRHQRLQEADQNTWWETMGKLQRMLRKAAQVMFITKKLNKEQMHNYFMSVTEREIQHGLLLAENVEEHCLAYIRNIKNVNIALLRFASKFVDIAARSVDNEAQKYLNALRDEKIPKKLPASNIARFEVEWSGKEGIDKEAHAEYLKEFCEHYFNDIIRLVDQAMDRHEQLTSDSVYSDVLQHLHACETFCKVFQGREETVEKIHQYIMGSSVEPLVLSGESGCGKTSLMAKGASKVPDWYPDTVAPVMIIRFLGTSPDSSSIIPLLKSLCHQIAHVYCQDMTEIPNELAPLCQHFKKLLTCMTELRPLVIFLDSLDQLSGTDGAHQLAWLPMSLPKNVRIIVSTLPNYFSILDTLKRMISEEGNFVIITPLGQDLGSAILRSWLGRANRSITEEQWKIVNEAISKCNLPLFVKLVCDEICRWKSYSKPQLTTLCYTIHDTIIKLFDRIEIQHGKTLVSHALGYITASKSGVSEAELEDLLSLDEKVLNDVYQYHLPPVRRIPPLLWTRLRSDLPGYLSEREADGVSVVNWYHRQFIDASRERYFRNLNFLSEIHSNIAEYFLGTWGGGKPKPFEYSDLQRQRFGLEDKYGESDRKLPIQPAMFYDDQGKVTRYNLRKLSELPFQLIRSHRYDDLYQHCLFNYQFLLAKLSSMPLQASLQDFEDALDYVFDKDTKLLSDTLRLSGSVLAHHPAMLGPQITGRLLPYYNTHQKIRALIQQCDSVGVQYCALVPSYHCLHTPGGPLQYSLEGHPFAPFGIGVTSDTRYLISVSNRIIIWDLSTGEVFRTVIPGIEGIMQNLGLSPNDKMAVGYTNNNQVVICTIMTGDFMLLEKVVEGSEPILGSSVSNTHFAVYTAYEWYLYTMDAVLVSKAQVPKESPLIQMHLGNDGQHVMVLKSGEEDDNDMTFEVQNGTVDSFEFHSAMAIAQDMSTIYCCIEISDNCVAVYKRDNGAWRYNRTLDENHDPVFALTLCEEETYLVATIASGYKLWDLKTDKVKHLKLPSGIRNIPTKNQLTGVVNFTKHSYFVVAGVRKNLYVWDVKNGNLVKTLDAHFGRIIALQAVTSNNMNKVISSSIDKTIKVWNFDNIYEDVHTIDRHEKPIESLSLANYAYLGVTTTRNNIGVWNLENGHLQKILSSSSHSSIVTHACITAEAQYVISAESNNVFIWDLPQAKIVRQDPEKEVLQLELNEGDEKYTVISRSAGTKARVTCRTIPEGDTVYSFEYSFKKFKRAVLSKDGVFVVVAAVQKNDEVLGVFQGKTGAFIYNVQLKYNSYKEFTQLVAMPNEPTHVALIDSEKGNIFDIKKKSLVRSIPKWNGLCTQNGKYGLYAPSRGGLELLDLKTGKVAKTLIPRVAEGVFSVNCMFTKNDQHVIYYHSGHRTIQVFRVTDGKRIANYKAHADITAIAGTGGGSSIVIGAVDGSLTMLTIADPDSLGGEEFLQSLPSRQNNVSSPGSSPKQGSASGRANGKLSLDGAMQVSRFVGKGRMAQKSRACVIS
ncbi:NACHT and WD repeat domain-containing protein 2 [Lingula anatina]|uniref:NACHT and WD repeat domain-containing protein 2 n=1 Tax=Lingula anatina TaxID=7574 RepID=A0A1S3KFF1_LINAN|nr:NACHT and WD repeat domain-containing protein 2 [Lingula anatina]XP_013421184.1 NACHT and WD repeat domain-containing protein 2 [Lingula anatina]|eukprot:XP_013421183.1 NACHT and WD repeat domain-containing protein 2 [Lingula anatina]